MLIEASESSILYASLSLCQTLFTLSAGRSHSEGWRIDLNTRQRGVCGRETQTGTDRESYRGDRMRKRVGWRCRADAPDSPANPFSQITPSLLNHQKACGPLISKGWTQTKER